MFGQQPYVYQQPLYNQPTMQPMQEPMMRPQYQPTSAEYTAMQDTSSVIDGVDTSGGQRRARNPETGRNELIEDMTYAEWAGWKQKTNKVENAADSATMKEKMSKGGVNVQTIGKIDIHKYETAADGVIRSEKLVLTENQKEHIIKRRGQEFYDKFSRYFADIAIDPDYIFEDEAHKNTALASKTITSEGKNVHLVIKLALVGDEEGIENSIITAIVEGDKRYQQRLRNKKPLYKKE